MAGEPTPFVIVTGASSGIGYAIAEALAKRAHNLVLIARREGPLADVAQKLSKDYGIKAEVIPADLSDPETPDALLQETLKRGLKIGGLVNNAGFGVPGLLSEVEWQRHRTCLEVMAVAPVHLTQLFAPEIVKSGGGMIINVSSLSAILPPHAGGTLYYPVKSFLYQFSLAMREELKPDHIHVTALCPGFTETNFQNAAGGTVESVAMPHWTWSKAEDVAEAAVIAVERNKAVCIPGLVNKVIALVFKLAPSAVGRMLVHGTP
ncbi:SDR family NAD(P)-dependent oxidoreductase [Actibacterium pelagium]|uniref:Dehydrogenase n=1 Tax=Actibacterium pelagium TaxID=2029103 RepID=A0A917EP53_9RHOB|nr:SDR family oxidoreductase [Actibacterium pelagium]GGE61913.1 dehydrogenase [Actibacterium pelagium]